MGALALGAALAAIVRTDIDLSPGVIGLATVLYAIFNIFLWSATANLVRGGRSDQRAWIGIPRVELTKEPVEGDHTITIHYFATNTGKTPVAENVVAAALIGLWDTKGEPPTSVWDLVPTKNRGIIFLSGLAGPMDSTLIDIPPTFVSPYLAHQSDLFLRARVSECRRV